MFKLLVRRLGPLVILAAAIGGASLLMATKEKPEKREVKALPPVVEVMTAHPTTLTLDINSYGTVEPKLKTQLTSEVQGRIISLSDKFVAGGHVVKGELLANIEPADYQAAVRQSEAALAQAQASLNEEKARAEVAKTEFRDFKRGAVPALGLRLPQLKREEANVKSAQAALESARRNLVRTEIRSPFTGLIRTRNIQLGQYVGIGSNLGEIYGTGMAEIRLPVTPDNLAALSNEGMKGIPVTFAMKSVGETLLWQGTLVRSEGIVDPQNRMIYLVAEVASPYDQPQAGSPLRFGAFVNATIEGKQAQGITQLPRYVVSNNQVAVITADNTVAWRGVDVIGSRGNNLLVSSGLKEGDRIALTGPANLKDGMKVTVAEDNRTATAKPDK
ncbi:efflux RND transporter periplasmic adaptor subunit [Parasalinivibrio latis]|uniref:efflux RND transporter periplasmic adaptor subunit n=1 Tax=Parasalinivibrio latis TaxID=2952610 RepID=UPI0030E05A32